MEDRLKDSNIVHFDKILVKYLGEFGRYQAFILFAMFFVGIATSGHHLGHVFLAAIPNYWCHVENCTYKVQQQVCGDFNLSRWECEDAIVDYTSPVDNAYGDTKTIDESQCRVYKNVTCNNWMPNINITVEHDSPDDIIECKDGWDYDQSTYEASIVTDFDLVCTNAYLESLASSLLVAGMLVGVPINGALADRFGRKRMLLVTGMITSIVGTIASFSVNYTMFVICRFVIGSVVNSLYILAFVMVSEFVGPSKRATAIITMPFSFTTGYILLTLLAYFLRDWRGLELAISLPFIPMFFLFIWILPESPRWLLSKPDKVKVGKGREIIRKMAKINKRTLPADVLDPRLYEDVNEKDEENEVDKPKFRMKIQNFKNGDFPINEDKNKDVSLVDDKKEISTEPDVIDLFRLPNMRRKTLNLYYNWFVNGLVYYGLSLNTSNLAGSDYLNAFISAAVEIPATLLAWWAMDVPWIGRVKTLALALILAGVSCVITPFPPQAWLSITFAMIGKFGSKISFFLVYVVSAEIYPTSVRSVGMGTSSMWGRVGSLLAPQLIFIGQTWAPLPYFVYGVTSILGGLLTLLLPETVGMRLPKTLEEGEAFGKKFQTVKETYYSDASLQTDFENGGFE